MPANDSTSGEMASTESDGRASTAGAVIAVGLGLPLLVGLLILAMFAAAVTFTTMTAQQAATSCQPVQDRESIPNRAQGSVASPAMEKVGGPPAAQSYDRVRRQQIANARLIERGVHAAGGSGRAVYVALVAAVGESDLINVNYGDTAGPDSRGLFQQRTSWGSLQQRMNPVWAAGAFMLGPGQRRVGGLLQLPGWQQLPVTTAIHRVQINADPNHYAKFESRAQQIARQAGIDLDAAAGDEVAGSEVASADCSNAASTTEGLTDVGSGRCPLDRLHAPGRTNPRDCNGALSYLTEEMRDGTRAWRRQCMALVAVAYGWRYSGNDTAFTGAQRVIAAGKMSTDRTNIPRGAVMWWDGRATGNSAGHVAIYDGDGHILSNDVPVTDGRVGRVPWTYPETSWGQKWLGWSPPYMPHAG